MNPLLQRALESFFRWALTFVSAWFVQRGIWSSEHATEYVAAAAVALAVLAWGIYDKYRSQQRQNTTIGVLNSLTGQSTANVTAADIDKVIAKGDSASATTPKNEAPVVTGTGNGMAEIRFTTGTGDGR